jgi:SagB-type dehydrogenase family enzyme
MDAVRAYHQRSKHHPRRYAPGPGGLDWASQPDPFRRFAGAPRVEPPLLAGETAARWDALFTPGGVPARRFALDTLGPLLQLSLGLAAWKSQGGSRWALRCNPSSGNLHPTEAYLICPDLPGLAAGVYHYRPDDHSLERRAAAPLAWSGGVLLALTGIHWREAWKYGMRAFRYCQHDCGHALAAIAYAAAALGWPARLLDDWGDDQVAALAGVDRDADFQGAEAEATEALVWLGPGLPPAAGAVLAMLQGAEWRGQANRLSRDHRDWPDIPEVAAATFRPAGVESLLDVSTEASADARAMPPPLAPVCQEPASVLIRRRRSAQAFDGVTGLEAAAFYRLLDALLPRPGQPPWSLSATPPRVHPVLFAHRVTGLEPGVYCLVRDPAQRPALAAAMRPDWLWVRPPGCPEHLPLYLLAPLDTREFAAFVACRQDIAGDSAFSLAMLADFGDITPQRPWLYRQRFQEAGMLGHALYLEAEAAGRQGTGIGCYFDDVAHDALGIATGPEDTPRFQDVYHFTVGGALVDGRLASEPAYAHLAERPAAAI